MIVGATITIEDDVCFYNGQSAEVQLVHHYGDCIVFTVQRPGIRFAVNHSNVVYRGFRIALERNSILAYNHATKLYAKNLDELTHLVDGVAE